LTRLDLELVLDASEGLKMNVIDAYLEMLNRGNTNYYGYIPSYVIHRFRSAEIFPEEWLENTLQQNILKHVQHWIIPSQLNTNYWVLIVMYPSEKIIYYYDSSSPGSINNEFMMEIFKMFRVLYPLSEQFNSTENYQIMSVVFDFHTLENVIDSGVFMLIYVRDIFLTDNRNTEIHLNQSGVKETRKRIYRELMADRL
jgi:Ulp1 family protease